MSISSKATRVEEVAFEVGRCPVCNKGVTGTATVAIHLGALETQGVVDGQAIVTVNATPQLRAMRIRHDCEAPVTRTAADQ